ncbi:hypothetical protein OS493_040078, partial [Desmophyllum pertusum]
ENKCIFKYIHGNTGSVKAISPTLFIYNPYAELTSPHGRPRLGSLVPEETLLEFSIAGLQANGLKKNIFGKPSPYVKLSIMPSRRHLRSWKQHHGQIAKTSSQTNTINPKWSSEARRIYKKYLEEGRMLTECRAKLHCTITIIEPSRTPSDLEVSSPTESVVMAVPLSPLTLRTSSPGAALTVVVADGVAETAALVYAITISRFRLREDKLQTSDNQSTIVCSRATLISYINATKRYWAISLLPRNFITEETHHKIILLPPRLIYATPLSGLIREFTDHSASFPEDRGIAVKGPGISGKTAKTVAVALLVASG